MNINKQWEKDHLIKKIAIVYSVPFVSPSDLILINILIWVRQLLSCFMLSVISVDLKRKPETDLKLFNTKKQCLFISVMQ